MRPAGPAVPLPLGAREPILSNERSSRRYVSLSLLPFEAVAHGRGKLVSRTRSTLAEAGARSLQGRHPGARDLSPSRGSAAFCCLAPVTVLGQQSRGGEGVLALGGGPGACSVRYPAGPIVGQGPEDQHGCSAAPGAGETSASLAPGAGRRRPGPPWPRKARAGRAAGS